MFSPSETSEPTIPQFVLLPSLRSLIIEDAHALFPQLAIKQTSPSLKVVRVADDFERLSRRTGFWLKCNEASSQMIVLDSQRKAQRYFLETDAESAYLRVTSDEVPLVARRYLRYEAFISGLQAIIRKHRRDFVLRRICIVETDEKQEG